MRIIQLTLLLLIIMIFFGCNIFAPKIEEIEGMVFVKGGTFTMGNIWSLETEPDTQKVTLSSYYIAKKEVTVEDFINFLNSTKTTSSGKLNEADIIDMDGEAGICYDSSFYFSASKYIPQMDCAAVGLSWYAACLYCNWYSKLCGRDTVYIINGIDVTADFNKSGYRLPTEAEWEYAARDQGGNINRWSGTDDYWDIEDWMWYNENTYKLGEDHIDYGVHPGGLKFPNEIGIYDMSGNVKEWCWDWYGEYLSEAVINPHGPESGIYKIFRGGSWLDGDLPTKVYTRTFMLPYYAELFEWGFRLAVTYIENK